MKEGPILFSTPMAIATVEGRKTQTRRIVQVQPPNDKYRITTLSDNTARNERKQIGAHQWAIVEGVNIKAKFGPFFRCPYGVPGDRLWGKETFYAWGRWETQFDLKLKRDAWHFVDMTLETKRAYLFDQPDGYKKGLRGGATPQWWKRPAIFMPRVAARIVREIVSIRVERVQDISVEDAIAEGLSSSLREHDACCDLLDQFAKLWDDINGKRAPWKSNPYVWVIKYKPIEEPNKYAQVSESAIRCVRCHALEANYCFPIDFQMKRPYCADCYFDLQRF